MTDQQPSEMNLPDALGMAILMHRNGELKDAETLYHRILDAAPDYADAVHFYGVMLHHRDRSDEAIAMIERSIALDPTPGRYNNLGNALVERGRLNEAIDAYRRSIDLDPTNADAYNNLGSLQKAQGRFEESEAAYLKALEINPEHINALTNLGNLRSDQGRHNDGVALYWKAISLNPGNDRSRYRLGYAYYAVKQFRAAAEAFRLWLQTEPGNPIALHMLAALSGENIPTRASDAYIEQTFDGFAASFDAKLELLSYRAPQLIAAAVGRVAGEPGANRAILDAGCGTGLCGPLLAPYASRLTGVDLSSRMAATPGLCGDVRRALAAQPRAVSSRRFRSALLPERGSGVRVRSLSAARRAGAGRRRDVGRTDRLHRAGVVLTHRRHRRGVGAGTTAESRNPLDRA